MLYLFECKIVYEWYKFWVIDCHYSHKINGISLYILYTITFVIIYFVFQMIFVIKESVVWLWLQFIFKKNISFEPKLKTNCETVVT